MIKKRWLKHLLAGLCLLIAIPAFAQEKYWIRVSDYSDLLTREIDTVSNLCKQNPTYGSYATGEHTYPGTLPMAGIRVQCSMENPNSTFKSFGMDVYCPKGFSHRSMVGIENGLEEGCYSQMTCEEATKQGYPLPKECNVCDPGDLSIPENDSMCPPAPPKSEGGVYGVVACKEHDDGKKETHICTWPQNTDATDPQALKLIQGCIVKHEGTHEYDYVDGPTKNQFACEARIEFGGKFTVGAYYPYAFLTEVSAHTAEQNCLTEIKSQCCTPECLSDIDTQLGYTKNAIRYYQNKYNEYCNKSENTCPQGAFE